MYRASLLPLALLGGVLVLGSPRMSLAEVLVWETGILSGHAENQETTNKGIATGTFYFDAGYAGVVGVDYASSVPQSSPGPFYVSYVRLSPGVGTWEGNFVASDASIINGATNGSYHWTPTRLTLDGEITKFNAPGQPLPPFLSELRVSADTQVSNITSYPSGLVKSYDFAGPFQVTAEFDVCAVGTRSSTSGAPSTLSVDFVRSPDPSCRLNKVEVDVGLGNTLDLLPASASCPASVDSWTGAGTSQVTIVLGTPLLPGGAWTSCITDSLGSDWDTGQKMSMTFGCEGGVSISLEAPFSEFYDVEAGTTIRMSRAILGACQPDHDQDGWLDVKDNCPDTPNPEQEDADRDGVGDACDTCPDVSNAGQEDRDGDGIGDACEAQCDDQVDNDADGHIDFPNDPDCISPEDDDERSMECVPLLTGAGKDLVSLFRELVLATSNEELTSVLEARRQRVTKAKLAVAAYFYCGEIPNSPKPELPFCLAEPIVFGPAKRCPPVDCFIDGPGCMDPYPYLRALVPIEALRVVALWSQGRITPNQLDGRLSALAEADKLRVDTVPPDRIRHLPRLGIATGIGLVIGVLGVGLLIGWLLRGRGRRDRPPL